MTARKKSNGAGREVLITALQLVLGLIGGSLLCAVWLITKPVTIMDAPPPSDQPSEDPHELVYIPGRPATRASQGVRQQRAFFNRTPGEIVLAEQDVNRWLSSVYGAKERTFALKGTGTEFSPRAPTVRLAGDELQIGVEIDVERNSGKSLMVAQARGRFVERNGKQVFAPRQVYLGSCPLPWNLGGSLIYGRMASLFSPPENAVSAWSAVSHAAIIKDRLHLHIGEPPQSAPIEVSPQPAAEVAPSVPPTAPETTVPATTDAVPAEALPEPSDETTAPAEAAPDATTAPATDSSAEVTEPVSETPAATSEPAPPTESEPAPTDESSSSVPAETPPAVETPPSDPASEPVPSESTEPAAPTPESTETPVEPAAAPSEPASAEANPSEPENSAAP